jgi:hypothetical protein
VIFFLQENGEIEPAFFDKVLEESCGTLKITNYVDRCHTVTCNENIYNPLIVEGWKQLGDVFGFTGNQVVVFAYHGGNVFGLFSVSPLIDNVDVPIYHSRSMRGGYTWNFCGRLSSDIISKPYLVSYLW